METIKGYEALRQMRAMRHDETSYCMLHHVTYNSKRKQTDGINIVRRCRLRVALPTEARTPHPDLFLPYTDLDAPKVNQNRMCYKRLIRYVAFPPEYKLLKTDWHGLKANGEIQIISEWTSYLT